MFFEILRKIKPQTSDIAALFLLAFFIRLWFCYNHFWIAGDSSDYIDLAKNLHLYNLFGFSNGNQLIPTSNPGIGLTATAFRPLLYSLLGSLFWTGEDYPYNTILFIQSLLGAVTVVLTYAIARHYFTRRIAFISALLLAISPLVIIVTGAILTETLFTFLTISGCYLLIKNKGILAGVIFGLAFLTRPIMLPFLLFLIVISLFSANRKRLITTFGLAALVMVLVASPWMIRNSLLFHKLILTQSSGYGSNLLVGSMNTPARKEASENDYWNMIFREPWKFKIPPVDDPPFAGLDEADQDRVRGKIALELITKDPLAWLKVRARVYPRLFLIDDGNYVLSEQNNISIGQAVTQRNVFVIVIKALLFGGSLVLFILALSGIYFIKDYFETITIWALPVFFALIHLPMGIEGRYFIPALPFYYLLATVGGSYLINRLAKVHEK